MVGIGGQIRMHKDGVILTVIGKVLDIRSTTFANSLFMIR